MPQYKITLFFHFLLSIMMYATVDIYSMEIHTALVLFCCIHNILF